MKEILATFSNLKIALLILNRLWMIYNAAGESQGKSLRASLVEAVSKLVPLNNYYQQTLKTEDLIEEATHRERSFLPLQLILRFGNDLKSLTDIDLIKLMLIKLDAWYMQQCSMKDDPNIKAEWAFVGGANKALHTVELMGLLKPVDFQAWLDHTPEQLFREVDSRDLLRNGRGFGWV